MVGVSGWGFAATGAEWVTDHVRLALGAAMGRLGTSIQVGFLSGQPIGSLRRRPPPGPLHHTLDPKRAACWVMIKLVPG